MRIKIHSKNKKPSAQKPGDYWNEPFRFFCWEKLYAICEQRRHRSAYASTQTDRHLCCPLPRWYTTYYLLNESRVSRLISLCSWAGWFESSLVSNPKDRFSCDGTQMFRLTIMLWSSFRKDKRLLHCFSLWKNTRNFNIYYKPKIRKIWKFEKLL